MGPDTEPPPVIFREQPRAYQERYFYERLGRLFFLRFGDDRGWAAASWASAREQGVSPVVALRHIYFDFIGRPGDLRSNGGAVLDAICRAWRRDGGEFRSPYALDMVDVFQGRETRTLSALAVSTDPPLPMDIWSRRLAGEVDEELIELREDAGLDPMEPVALAGSAAERDEVVRTFFVARCTTWNAEHHNDENDWKPHQVEAIGRFQLQRELDLEPLTADEIFDEADLDG